MITSPSENTALTPEQLRQINVASNRLENLQKEIGAAVSELTAVRLDTEQLAKDKAYQAELLDQATTRVKELDDRKAVLLQQVKDAQDDCDRINTSIRIDRERLFNDQIEFETKAKKLEFDLVVYEEKFKALEAEKVQTNLSRCEVNKAKEALLAAIQSITWK